MLGCAVKSKSFSWPAGGEVRQFEAGLPSALFGGFHLDPQQSLEELGVSDVVLACLVEVGGERLRQRPPGSDRPNVTGVVGTQSLCSSPPPVLAVDVPLVHPQIDHRFCVQVTSDTSGDC